MLQFFLLVVLVFVAYKVMVAVAGKKSRDESAAGDFSIRVSVPTSRYYEEIENPSKPDDLWIPPGRDCKVGPFLIPGGMLYVGKDLPSVKYSYCIDPAQIDPRLEISKNPPDLCERLVAYWPSYSEISPEARAAYLTWLATGKSAPDADLGYVFLYFYGLERRVLADAETSRAAASEVPVILAEVERLLSIYGDHGSFGSYAGGFLSFCRADEILSGKLYDSPPPSGSTTWELPFELKVGLGQLVTDGKQIPEDWAFAWMKLHPGVNLRTPATRCSEEFEQLFKMRYRSRFRGGMKMKPNKTKLSLDYRPASGSFSGSSWSRETGLPDVSVLSAPINKFQEITSACCDDLASYSRLLGRNPEAKGSLEALALLPDELASETTEGEAGQLKAFLRDALEDSLDTFLKADDLIRFWPSNNPDKLTKKEAVQFTQLLERWGYCLEPDVRFGGKPLSNGEKIFVFRMDGEKLSSPSREYSAAMLVMHLSAMVSAADGHIADQEKNCLEEHLESALDLSGAERTRLRAHMKWLLAAQPGFAGTKKKIESLGEHQRTEVGRFLVSVACADGRIEPEEVKILTRTYKMMGFPETALHSQLHQTMGAAAPPAKEPVTVRPAGPDDQGFGIPKTPQATPQMGVSLDMKRIQHTLAETAAVSALLGDIFTEEDDSVSSSPAPTTEAIAGLDGLHSALIKHFEKQTSWPRVELEQWVETQGLMLDGAIEVINEAAYDIADMPLCEGDDPIEVDRAVLEEMMQ